MKSAWRPRSMATLAAVAATGTLLIGCTGIPDGTEPVTGFELERYLGEWYEIARLDHSFEEGLDCVTATYSLRDDGGVKVINRGYNLEEQAWDEAEGRAYFIDDESVGRLLKYLDDHDLSQNTLVIYSSDQGFYLGEHGWYDKRWMFEESFRMPFIAAWPGKIQPKSKPSQLIQNIDYAPTFLEVAGLKVPSEIQGRSLVPLMQGESVDWRSSLYYSYYELGEHAVPQHFGVRTARHKLIHFPISQEWNLFDLKLDPSEMRSVHDDPQYASTLSELKKEFQRLRNQYEAPPLPTR